MNSAEEHPISTDVDEQGIVDEKIQEIELSTTEVSASTKTGTGDLVESTLNSRISENLNFSSGGFVYRDPAVFIGRDISRASYQIKHLRDTINRLRPVEANLVYLTNLREPVVINSCIHRNNSVKITPPIFKNIKKSSLSSNNNFTKYDLNRKYLSKLSDIEGSLGGKLEPEQSLELVRYLNIIADDIDYRILEANRSFDSAMFPVLSRTEFVEAMISKIGHRELQEEAKLHLSVIRKLVSDLNPEHLINKDFDILSDEAQAVVGKMVAIEKRRIVVEDLVRSDQELRKATVKLVSRYICWAISFAILVPIVATLFNLRGVTLDKLELPLLRVPVPVIIWSLIGSFAAMIHSFNRKPIYDFDDAVKWMFTRPVQGVVLGSAFYLVLNSGLFVLTGSTDNQSSRVKDEVILVLSFLVGFSDRFVDSVFNALVDRYSRETTSSKKEIDESSKSTTYRRSKLYFREYERHNIKPKKRLDTE